jgi:hypothetical protein
MSGLDVEHAPEGREPQAEPRRPDAQNPDVELQDEELQQEIELVADLVVAASGSDGPLSQVEIDQALGLRA